MKPTIYLKRLYIVDIYLKIYYQELKNVKKRRHKINRDHGFYSYNNWNSSYASVAYLIFCRTFCSFRTMLLNWMLRGASQLLLHQFFWVICQTTVLNFNLWYLVVKIILLRCNDWFQTGPPCSGCLSELNTVALSYYYHNTFQFNLKW